MFVIGAGGVIFTFAVVLALQGLYYARQNKELDEKLIAVPYTEALETKAAGQEHLENLGWVDQQAGRVHIPIEQAKAAYLENLR